MPQHLSAHPAARRGALSAVVGFGLVAGLGLGAIPASAAPASADANTSASASTSTQRYVGDEQQQQAQSKAAKKFFQAVVEDALQKQAADPGAKEVTVTYDASEAPTFQSEIANAAKVWNASVSNVQLQEGSNASFSYEEGDDPRGSYASTDGHGNGYIFLDYAQNEEYDSNRVAAHETGHVLGLPDTYDGPCEELMSGGGPGPSCTNDQPNDEEKAEVEDLWANGVRSALQTAAF